MPVIQGRLPEDYERCIDALWGMMKPGAIIGVGSMCRREIDGPEGLIAVIDHLDRVLPKGVRLHAFGVKGRSEEHTSELQSLMRLSYAVFCLKKKQKLSYINEHHILQ